MYYGKQIRDNQKITYISSSLPLPYSETLINITASEFNAGMQQEMLRKQQEEELRKREEYDIVERDQEIIVDEKNKIEVE